MSPEASALSSWLSLERGRRLLCSIAGTKHSLDPLTFSCHLLITLFFFCEFTEEFALFIVFLLLRFPMLDLGRPVSEPCLRWVSNSGVPLLFLPFTLAEGTASSSSFPCPRVLRVHGVPRALMLLPLPFSFPWSSRSIFLLQEIMLASILCYG